MAEPKRSKNRRSKLPALLTVCAVILALAGGVFGVWAYMGVFSDNYNAGFAMNHIDVELIENGMTRTSKDRLLEPLDGHVTPGRVYTEKLAGRNSTDVPELVRMSVRKYWLDKDGNKDQTLDPSLIELGFGDKAYNSSAWQINPDETTAERSVYYYRKALAAYASTEPVTDTLCVSSDVIKNVTVKEDKTTVPGKTIYTYEYDYDGKRICIEADVQSVQVNNANDAIRSIWGVPNVSFDGSTLSVAGAEGGM